MLNPFCKNNIQTILEKNYDCLWNSNSTDGLHMCLQSVLLVGLLDYPEAGPMDDCSPPGPSILAVCAWLPMLAVRLHVNIILSFVRMWTTSL